MIKKFLLKLLQSRVIDFDSPQTNSALGIFSMFFKRPLNCARGIIALDIDGTLTAEGHRVDPDVVDRLGRWAEEGWQFIFITGRSFQLSAPVLASLPFSYGLAVHNGALLLEMPSKIILGRTYLHASLLPGVESLCTDLGTDFVVYSGLEHGDRCYYRPERLPPPFISYLRERTASLGEQWQPIQELGDLPIVHFCSLKLFVKEEEGLRLSSGIHALGLHAPLSRDAFNCDYRVIQVTHAEATKGEALRKFAQLRGITRPLIAAGDDRNDWSMLEAADVKVVMADAPAELLEMADVIAPPARQKGVIRGIEEAVALQGASP